jgi:hypothetical protein
VLKAIWSIGLRQPYSCENRRGPTIPIDLSLTLPSFFDEPVNLYTVKNPQVRGGSSNWRSTLHNLLLLLTAVPEFDKILPRLPTGLYTAPAGMPFGRKPRAAQRAAEAPSQPARFSEGIEVVSTDGTQKDVGKDGPGKVVFQSGTLVEHHQSKAEGQERIGGMQFSWFLDSCPPQMMEDPVVPSFAPHQLEAKMNLSTVLGLNSGEAVPDIELLATWRRLAYMSLNQLNLLFDPKLDWVTNVLLSLPEELQHARSSLTVKTSQLEHLAEELARVDSERLAALEELNATRRAAELVIRQEQDRTLESTKSILSLEERMSAQMRSLQATINEQNRRLALLGSGAQRSESTAMVLWKGGASHGAET